MNYNANKSPENALKRAQGARLIHSYLHQTTNADSVASLILPEVLNPPLKNSGLPDAVDALSLCPLDGGVCLN